MTWLRSFGNGRALLWLLTVFILGAATALSLSACRWPTDEMGVVGVGLTDAAGDFLTYTASPIRIGSVVQERALSTQHHLGAARLAWWPSHTGRSPRPEACAG